MAWGSNGSGQLGNPLSGPTHCGVTPCSETPIAVGNLAGVAAVSAGASHSLALRSDGTVVAWGDNSSGELGDGTRTSSYQPVSVKGLSGAIAVAAGRSHSLALLRDGTVVAWGENQSGELGDGTTNDSTVPVPVKGLSGVTSIGAANDNSFAVLADGTVMAWGLNESGQLGRPASGPEKCGRPGCSRTPVPIPSLGGVTAVAGGEAHGLALLKDGTVMAWGSGQSGQLGDGSTGDSYMPVAVKGLSGVTAIAVGKRYNLALLANGSVMAWGDNAHGQLGDGTSSGPSTCPNGPCSTTPVAVNGLSGVAGIAAGAWSGFALLSDGTAVAWGDSTFGELGNGTTTSSDVPLAVKTLSGTTRLAAGATHVLALKGTTPSPPTVITTAPTHVAQTGETLNGTVNPNGVNVTDCHFEYGTTTAYGSTANCTPSPGSGNSSLAVSAVVGGLKPNTTYHCRLTAINAAGTSHGNDVECPTSPRPPTAVTAAPSAITQTSATLEGAVNPIGQSTHCHFGYGTSTAYGSTAACAPDPGSSPHIVTVSAPVTGLTPNTSYHVELVATYAGGVSEGGDVEFRTLPFPPIVVTLPATSIAGTSATLNGLVNPNGASAICHFEYGTTTAYGSSASCAPPPGSGTLSVSVKAPISGLQRGITYHFRIAVGNGGGSSIGHDLTFTTGAVSTVAYVPHVVGLSRRAGEVEIRSAGLVPEALITRTAKPGQSTIFGQLPPADTEVARNTSVAIYLQESCKPTQPECLVDKK